MRLDIARPSGSRTVGTDTTSTGKSRSRHHAADEQQLLGVLLAEVGRVGAGEVHELGDDGEHAVEVAGPGLALEDVAERAGRDPDARVAVLVDDVGGRGEDEVDARGRADLQVGVEGARVAREVLAWAELQRVEEDRDDDVCGALASGADQGRVPVVQRAHGHDDGDVAVVEQAAGRRAARHGCGRRRVRRWAAPRAGAVVSVTVGRSSCCEQLEQRVGVARPRRRRSAGPRCGRRAGQRQVGRADVRGQPCCSCRRRARQRYRHRRGPPAR